MNKKSIIIAIIVAIVMSILSIKIVNAEESNNIILSSSKEKLKAGEEIQVTISNRGISDNQIQIVSGKIEYDHSILELVSSEDDGTIAKVEDKNDWEATVGVSESKFIVQNLNSKDGEMFTITFKVLSDSNNAKVSLSDLKLVNSNYELNDLTANDLELKGSNKKIILISIVAVIAIVIIVAAIFIIRRKK